jgi:hypothetical protein
MNYGSVFVSNSIWPVFLVAGFVIAAIWVGVYLSDRQEKRFRK